MSVDISIRTERKYCRQVLHFSQKETARHNRILRSKNHVSRPLGEVSMPHSPKLIFQKSPLRYFRREMSTQLGEQVDGAKAWSVSVGCLLIGFVTAGLMYSQGIFLESLLLEFGQDLTTTSLVTTLCPAMFYIAGPFSAPMAAKYGVKRYTFVGASIWVAGCLLGSVSNSIAVSIITQGCMTGCGTGMCFWVSMSILPAWFNKYRATGIGIGVLGSGLGSVAYSIGGGELISSIGWRQTLRVFGGAGAGLLVVAIILLEPRPGLRKRKHGPIAVSLKLMHVRSFQFYFASFFFFQMGFFTPYTFLPHFATGLGFDPSFAAFTLAMLGIGSSVGRIIFSPVADTFKLRIFMFKSTTMLAAICLWVWSVCVTESSILAFCFLYGAFGGAFFAMQGVVAAEIWGPSNVAATFPMVNIVSIPGSLASSPIFAAIVESTGSYEPATFFSAAMMTMAFICVALIKHDGHLDPRLLPTPMTSSANLPLSSPRQGAEKLIAKQ